MRGLRLGSWDVGFQTDWSAVFNPSRWNWVDFTVVALTAERSKYMDSVARSKRAWDFHAGLLGFHVFVSNVYGYAEPLEKP